MQITSCTSSCTTYVPSGTGVVVYGYTPSTFGGWTGDCTSATNDCNLGTVVNNRAATVTFNRDEREVATLLPSTPVRGLTMTPDGDLLVGDDSGVSRITIAGVVVWTTSISGGASDLATDAAGNVYGNSGSGIFSLTPAGKSRWSRAITVAPWPKNSFQSKISVSPDGTVIAAHTSDGAHVVDGSGNDRFTATGLTSDGMAVAPDGTVGIGTTHPALALDVARYDSAGNALTTLSPLPGDLDASLVYDSVNNLCAQTTAQGSAVVSRTATNLSNVFSSSENTGLSPPPRAAIVVDSSGNVIAMRAATNDSVTGLRIEVFSPTGTSTWTHLKPGNNGTFIPLPPLLDGVTPIAAGTDGNHRVAVGGAYSNNIPWIQVYAMP
jgi:hypothetical protein